MPSAHLVAWYLIPSGYAVDVFDSELQPINEYRAGNHPLSSGDWLPEDHPRAVPAAKLREWAQQTATETAERFGLGADRIFHDADAERDNYEMRAEA